MTFIIKHLSYLIVADYSCEESLDERREAIIEKCLELICNVRGALLMRP